MAPTQSQDLDLSQCFKGEQQLVTWDLAYRALCHPETASKSEALRAFLSAKENTDILNRPWNPFPEPSAQEKAKFESKTAPISVTPTQTPTPHDSLGEIKEDSLWLSGRARISEYAALRLVVQEWQSRPTLQLLTDLTEEEALSVQEAAGIANLGASTFIPDSSILSSPLSTKTTQFETQDQRRLRIIDIYHSTCASIIRISQLLVSWGSASYLRSQTIYGNDYVTIGAGWIEELGQAIAGTQSNSTAVSSKATALDKCLEAVKTRCGLLEKGYDWDVPDSIIEAASEIWVVAQTTEVLHILHLALVHADLVTKGFIAAATVEDWISFFGHYSFFREFPVVSRRQESLVPVIQLLTTNVSLALLKVDLVLNDLESENFKNWDPSSYILNANIVENITTTFGAASLMGASPATPPIFAWSILTWRLTSRASREDKEREALLEASNGSRTSLPAPSAIEESAMAITRLETHELFDNKMPYEELAQISSAARVLFIINSLVEVGIAAFGTSIDQISRDRIRLLFLQLLRAALGSEIINYNEDLISTAYTILAGNRSFRNWVGTDASRQIDPVVAFFLEDEYVLRPLLLDEARTRYPYEMIPFLKFCSALTRGDKTCQGGLPTFVEKLINSARIMQRFPRHFKDYALTREDENANWVELTADLPLFSAGTESGFSSQRRLLMSTTSVSSDGLMRIPAGTDGNIVDDSDQPYIAVWHYPHSTLTYLVQLLSTYPVGSNKVETTTQAPATRESVLEIIGFFADLVHSSLETSEGVCSGELLEALSITGDKTYDSVNIILAIFEEELLRLGQEPNNETSLDLLVNCTHFLEALVVISPHRVWPWIARSRLLEGDGNSGGLGAILIGTEMVLGRYDFLIGCIRLYRALVKDAVDRSVSRKVPSKALTRFNASTPSESGTSDKIMSTILFTFGRTLANIYESSLGWKYTQPTHRPEINTAICEVFTTILQLAYGVDDNPTLSGKVTRSIAPIAEYLTQLYLTKTDNDLPTNPILASLLTGAGPEETTLLTSSAALWRQQTQTTLAFSDLLVRIAILLKKPWTHLEQQLFKATPLLARLYATSDHWKSQVVVLLETLVRGAVRGKGPAESNMEGNSTEAIQRKDEQYEPPSLLGHLGPRTAKNFLSVLSQLDEPLRIVDIQTNVWNLLSAVVTCKQQWFSLYLLTGSTPRESLRSKADAAPNSRSKVLLTRALDALSDLDIPEKESTNFSWPLYTAMLEFVSAARNNWSWAMGDFRQNKVFIQKLLAFLKWMAKQPKHLKVNTETLERSYCNRFASLACEVVAMYLHSSRQSGDVTVLKDVVPSLRYLEENALDLPSYNSSLHGYLKQNLERQFPGVSLANLKRTTLYPESFGRTFFYDVDLAQRLLGFDSKWSGPREGSGFSGEVEKANYNLGLVESQIMLLQGWKMLALELSYVVAKDERVVNTLIGVIKRCMVANADSSLPEALFGQLMFVRADLAFALLKQLVEAKVRIPELRQLLVPVWQAVRASTPDFDNVFSSDSVHYYRSLLRILYLALHFHLVDDSDQSEDTALRSSFRGTMPASHNSYTEPISNQLLEILSETVAKGFRSLANQLHADPSSVAPSDFALLTALLQRIIAIPEMSKWQTQAALLFANSNTTRYATSLFSWADRITLSNNGVDDPVYGELSLLFILTLSSIPALAETMAVDGILSQLNTANLMNYYRRGGGMGAFDSPARLYSIWTKGILPLCLNLFLSIGSPIAAEISSFLNQFPEQLGRASTCINSTSSARASPTKITLSIASEIHSLSLISAILENVRNQGPKLGIQSNEVSLLNWDQENVKEDLESWLSRKGALRERIIAADKQEVKLMSMKLGPGDDTLNHLEQRVVMELESASKCLGLGSGNGNGNGNGNGSANDKGKSRRDTMRMSVVSLT